MIVGKDDHYEGELVSSWGWHAPSPVAQQMGGGLILSNEVALPLLSNRGRGDVSSFMVAADDTTPPLSFNESGIWCCFDLKDSHFSDQLLFQS